MWNYSGTKQLGSCAWGPCRRGRSEIPHFCSKLQSFPLVLWEKRRKAKKNEEKQQKRKAKKNEEKKKTKTLSRSCYFLSSFLPVFICFSGSCFFFSFCLLLGSRCYFVFLFLLVVLFCFESSCLISFCFASCFLVVVFCFCCFGICNFWIFGYLSKTSLKQLEIAKRNKMKNAEKKDTGTRAVSTGVLTNSVFFCVSLNFAFFAENTIKRGFSKTKEKHKKQKSLC